MNLSNNEEHLEEKKNISKNNNSKGSSIIITNKELYSNLLSINKEKKDIYLLKKKTKSDNSKEFEDENNYKIKKFDDKIENEEYDYGYSIILLEGKEEGLMEDFLMESDMSDYYNYDLTAEKFQDILHDSLLKHYENHLKEEQEKRKKMQNMFLLNMNMNINMNNNIIPTSLMPQMNSLFMSNLNNNNSNNNNITYPIQITPIQNFDKSNKL